MLLSNYLFHMKLKAEGHLGPHNSVVTAINSATTKVILQIMKLKGEKQKMFSPEHEPL